MLVQKVQFAKSNQLIIAPVLILCWSCWSDYQTFTCLALWSRVSGGALATEHVQLWSWTRAAVLTMVTQTLINIYNTINSNMLTYLPLLLLLLLLFWASCSEEHPFTCLALCSRVSGCALATEHVQLQSWTRPSILTMVTQTLVNVYNTIKSNMLKYMLLNKNRLAKAYI